MHIVTGSTYVFFTNKGEGSLNGIEDPVSDDDVFSNGRVFFS